MLNKSNMNTMLRLWAWGCLFLSCTLIPSSNGAPKCNPLTTPVPNLDAAMDGYDPIMSNPLQRPDPGIRYQIFEPLSQHQDKSSSLNSFIAKARENFYCDSEMTVKTLRKYNEYKSEKFSDYTFSAGADVSTAADGGTFSYEVYAGYGREDDNEESKVRKFFEDTNGEIIQVKSQCLTHVIEIAPFEEFSFKRTFITAMRELHVAAKMPNSAYSNDTFIKFVGFFGTHFMKTTYLGSKIVFEKRFTSKGADRSSELSRSRCVANSAYARIGGSASLFSHSSEDCTDSSQNNAYLKNNKINSAIVISTGLLPLNNIKGWTAKESPLPVKYELEKISKIFLSQSINSIPLNDRDDQSEMLDGPAMHKFFEEKSADYCLLVLGKACPTEEQKGSGLNSGGNAPGSRLGYRSEVKYGGVIIAGGWDGIKPLSEVEAFNTWQPPSLPHAVRGLSLSAVGSKLYACGGYRDTGGSTDVCYKIDSSDSSPTWTTTTRLPIAMAGQTTTIMKPSNIWFVFYNKLYDLDTTNDRFTTYHLPFAGSNGHCAVSNDTHSHIIGAGSGYTEIWVNTVASSPEKWHKVATMTRGRALQGCLLLNGNVYITGGSGYRTDVEIFNTNTLEVTVGTGSLVNGRTTHKMIVLEGEPAVVGGIFLSAQGTIETFDLAAMTWKTSSRELQTRRTSFGLAQQQ